MSRRVSSKKERLEKSRYNFQSQNKQQAQLRRIVRERFPDRLLNSVVSEFGILESRAGNLAHRPFRRQIRSSRRNYFWAWVGGAILAVALLSLVIWWFSHRKLKEQNAE